MNSLHASLLLLIAVLCAIAPPFSAPGAEQQEPLILITAQSNTQEMRIGDTLICSITLEWDKAITVKKVEPSVALGAFEIQNVHESPVQKLRKGRLKKVYTYTLSTFDAGDFQIPPFRVHYATADGKEKRADSQSLKITVKGVLNTSDQQQTDVRDIKPPLSIPPDTRLRNTLIAAALALILVGVVAWRYIRKRILARRTPAEEWVPPKPIEELAYDDLNALEASDLLSKGRFKEYYTQLADIVRVYLGRRYRFAALDMTSFEILDKLGEFLTGESLLALIEEFFDECDLVKFAKFIPPEENCRNAIPRARRIVELTTPTPVAETPALAAASAHNGATTSDSPQRGDA